MVVEIAPFDAASPAKYAASVKVIEREALAPPYEYAAQRRPTSAREALPGSSSTGQRLLTWSGPMRLRVLVAITTVAHVCSSFPTDSWDEGREILGLAVLPA
jgi:hypothetical protein